MSYELMILPAAMRAIRRLDATVRKRIARSIDALGDDPRPQGSIRMQGDDDLWRLRVGDYRIVYAIQDRELIVLVVKVGHRKDVYRKRAK